MQSQKLGTWQQSKTRPQLLLSAVAIQPVAPIALPSNASNAVTRPITDEFEHERDLAERPRSCMALEKRAFNILYIAIHPHWSYTQLGVLY
jgi:hypothetical protein